VLLDLALRPGGAPAWGWWPGGSAKYRLDSILIQDDISEVAWEVEYTDQFGDWWESLFEEEQESLDFGVRLLEERGPSLPFPYSSGVQKSRHPHMRELRVQHAGRPYRVFYAFDPRRHAILGPSGLTSSSPPLDLPHGSCSGTSLVIGGDKTGHDRFDEEYVPIADRLYDEHLAEISPGRDRREGS